MRSRVQGLAHPILQLKKTEKFTKILNSSADNIAPDSDKQNLHSLLKKPFVLINWLPDNS